jgi:hypothetical protein
MKYLYAAIKSQDILSSFNLQSVNFYSPLKTRLPVSSPKPTLPISLKTTKLFKIKILPNENDPYRAGTACHDPFCLQLQ